MLRSGGRTLIPDFIDGVLPDGVHTCTLEEVAERFGRFQGSDQRPKLTEALKRYIKEVRSLGVATAVIIDGSYVTIKVQPSDIDMILVLRENVARRQEVAPTEYNVQSKGMVKKLYGFDIRSAAPDDPDYVDYLEWFLQVRPDDPGVRTSRKTKGVLRIDL